MTNDELPMGWTMAKFNQLIAADGLFSDGDWVESKDQDPNGTIRLLQLADIGDGCFIDKSSRFVNEEKFKKLRCTEVLQNDVLIARMPDPLGRACLAPKLKQKSITVVDVAIVRPGRKSVSPSWLMHFINSPEIRQHMELESTGSTRKRIARGKIAEIEMPVPPVAEQKRIADKLDALLGRMDACRARLDRVPALLKRFRQSVLSAATSGRLTAEWRMTNGVNDEWEETKLGQCGNVSGGLTKNSKRQLHPLQKPYLRVANVQANSLSLTDVAVIGLTEAEYRKAKLQTNDLLIVEGNGSIDQLGRVAIWSGELKDCVHQNHLIRWRTSGPVPRFILYWLLSPQGRDDLMDLASTTTGLHTLSISKVSSLPINLPTLPEQQEIVRRVEALFAFADRIEARLATAQMTVERLTPATLAKAFRGELVPQDPNDEPASALLERLQSQPAAKLTRATRKPRK